MPLTTVEKTALQGSAQAVLDGVNALTVDPLVNPLQADLDKANATIAQLTSDKQTLTDANVALTAKLAAVNADLGNLDAADLAGDAARAKLKTDVA